MTRSFRRSAALALVIVFAACSGSTTAAPPSPASTQSVSGCTAPEAAQFDFWVGSWRGRWADAQGAAFATDVVVRNGCEIDESFEAPRFLQHDNYSATSKSQWDPSLGKWVQDYSDSVGERSRWLGGFASGAMTLIGPQVGSRQQRIVWHDIESGGWTWDYDSSTDGSTWSAVVVIRYQRTQ
ncbi:MAG TPA: hypothetical protein VGV88_07315 [Candidatus Dormibacteraeota bacterium]|nr:hypothetical protein [Candidatus Dormibacteraeota bacterium]